MRSLRAWLAGIIVLAGAMIGFRSAEAAIVVATVSSVLLLAMIVVHLVERRRRRSRAGIALAARAAAVSEQKRVHIVLRPRAESAETTIVPKAEVPRVEHDGHWHTLH